MWNSLFGKKLRQHVARRYCHGEAIDIQALVSWPVVCVSGTVRKNGKVRFAVTLRWRERDSNPRSPGAKEWAPCPLVSHHGWISRDAGAGDADRCLRYS